MESHRKFDVIICGAGPAGLTCALALSDSGLKVAVVEKSSFPRDKICGDAIAAYVSKVLHSIHPRLKEEFEKFSDKLPVHTGRVYAPNRKYIDFTSIESGYVSMRKRFDNFLFELVYKQRNTCILTEHRMEDVLIDRDKKVTTVYTDKGAFQATLVIGCDGAHSVVNKKLAGTRPEPEHSSGAVRAYYKNVSGLVDGVIEVHFFREYLPGYFWIFPLKDNMTNVGLGVLSSRISERKLNLRQSMNNIIENEPDIRERFLRAVMIGEIEGFGLPLGSRKVIMSGDHFMLCGDAASLINPLTGEGIGQAMASGRYAGWHAKKCFERNDFCKKFMKQYDENIYKKFWRDHRRGMVIRKILLNRPWLLNAVANRAIKSRFVRDMIVKISV